MVLALASRPSPTIRISVCPGLTRPLGCCCSFASLPAATTFSGPPSSVTAEHAGAKASATGCLPALQEDGPSTFVRGWQGAAAAAVARHRREASGPAASLPMPEASASDVICSWVENVNSVSVHVMGRKRNSIWSRRPRRRRCSYPPFVGRSYLIHSLTPLR